MRPAYIVFAAPFAGRYNPSYHSEVVRAELDEPLGHIWMLDSVPPHSLIVRDRETKKAKEAITRVVRLVFHFCTVTSFCIRPKRSESACAQQ